MNLEYARVEEADRDALIDWLDSDAWPFHGQPQPDKQARAKVIDRGLYWNEGTESHWILEAGERIGLVRIYDLEDIAPLFDLRLKSSHRGRGLGVHALRWLTQHVFDSYSAIRRVEGYTREDNLAMRRTFEKCGYVKEAHHREAWPGGDGQLHASIGYGILRKDWESGETTDVPWHA